MTSSISSSSKAKSRRGRPVPQAKKRGLFTILGILSAAVIALGAIFVLNTRGGSSAGTDQAGQYPFQVGSPGPGAEAPAIALPSTEGGTFNLASLHGKTVLLYFQEGLMCQPCWDQLKDIEAQFGQFQSLGIDQVVSITTDDLNLLRQKVASEGLSTPVLSDPDLAVSKAYTTNEYGMMGLNYNGHTFIVIGPDGRIRWRADYGGAPKYTMYVPVPNLLADMRAGLDGGAQDK